MLRRAANQAYSFLCVRRLIVSLKIDSQLPSSNVGHLSATWGCSELLCVKNLALSFNISESP